VAGVGKRAIRIHAFRLRAVVMAGAVCPMAEQSATAPQAGQAVLVGLRHPANVRIIAETCLAVPEARVTEGLASAPAIGVMEVRRHL
jgi:hypothetical protein